MKKLLGTFLFLVLLLLFAACTSPDEDTRPNLPYRVWESWEEMKEVLGDHYLYPTYLPEVTQRSEYIFKLSDYNGVPRDRMSNELFSGYMAFFSGGNRMDDSITIQATDFERINYIPVPRASDIIPFLVPFDGRFQDSYRFNEHIVTIGGIDIEFVSLYTVSPPPIWNPDPDEWFRYYLQNGRAVLYTFKIDNVTYRMSWVQNEVKDKYADDEQREGMLRVAKSIIEQVREVE